MTAQLVLALIQAAASALMSPGITNARIQAIAGLVSKGTSLASVAATTGDHFVQAMQQLTQQVQQLHNEGRDDLTDAEQDSLDMAIRNAHVEIQASASTANPADGSTGI
jgi:hypothetical protein